MYNTQDMANRIKIEIKKNGKSIKDMLNSLDMGINTISDFSKGQQLSCISLAKIADYLGCSVDYLMGRTDNPKINQ